MRFLIDMNLSPDWIDVLTEEGWETVHWATVGAHRATDETIMTWAREHGYVVVTHDLDFAALLAATRAVGPSVIQMRAQDVLPGSLDPHIPLPTTCRLHPPTCFPLNLNLNLNLPQPPPTFFSTPDASRLPPHFLLTTDYCLLTTYPCPIDFAAMRPYAVVTLETME